MEDDVRISVVKLAVVLPKPVRDLYAGCLVSPELILFCDLTLKLTILQICNPTCFPASFQAGSVSPAPFLTCNKNKHGAPVRARAASCIGSALCGLRRIRSMKCWSPSSRTSSALRDLPCYVEWREMCTITA